MRVLYVEGDPSAPRWIAGALRVSGHAVDRVVRADPLPWHYDHDVIVLSDTPAAELEHFVPTVRDAVTRGRGLLVVGGPRSLGHGGWARSGLAEVLPVAIADADDRVEAPQGVLLAPTATHPTTQGLPFDRPPVIAGYNRLAPRGEVLLEGHPLVAGPGAVRLAEARVPLLAVGVAAIGRVAVLATDLAPPWSGGWTGWGGRRVTVGEHEEAGDAWVRFVDQLVRWLAGSGTGLKRRPGVGSEAALSA
ncbi:MAG: glutamine amidotransferase [Myxococcota bacterium]